MGSGASHPKPEGQLFQGECAAMGFDDLATEGQADAGTARLGCEKWDGQGGGVGPAGDEPLNREKPLFPIVEEITVSRYTNGHWLLSHVGFPGYPPNSSKR